MIYTPPNPRRRRFTLIDAVGAVIGGALLTFLFAVVIFGMFLGVG